MNAKIFFFICAVIILNPFGSNSLICQTNILNKDYSSLKLKEKSFCLVKEKDIPCLRFFGGMGMYLQLYGNGYQNSMFSFGAIPQLTKNMFLTLRVDGHKMFSRDAEEMMYGFGILLGYGKIITLFAGGNMTLHTLGKSGYDFSFIPSFGLEYQFVKFLAVYSEIRIPLYLTEETTHSQLMVNFNLVLKIPYY